ncbi:MLO-like protein 5 [Acorus calamus]|uniref:MLO-like protein 5 n=1 Tax=Acorus calamus TaxID=4465 RepID=A0AAV9D8B1_ACOCL|nr:MLO-like protein 5 [Acorus calamus]
MAGGGGAESRKLDQTPTWAVSAVCTVIIIISIVLEKVIHRVGEMGTHMKKSIFDEQTSRALKKWHKDAKKKQGKPSQGSRTPGGGTPEASPSASPAHPLKRFKTTGHLGSKKSRKYFSDPEFESPKSTTVLIQTSGHEAALAEEHHDGGDPEYEI